MLKERRRFFSRRRRWLCDLEADLQVAQTMLGTIYYTIVEKEVDTVSESKTPQAHPENRHSWSFSHDNRTVLSLSPFLFLSRSF